MKINREGLVKQVSLKVVLVALLFITALFGFAYIVREAVDVPQDAFDLAATRYFSAHLTPGLIRAMRGLTFFGSSNFLLPAYLVLAGYFVVIRRWQRAIDIAIIGLGSTGLMMVLKQVFHRHRPQLPIIKGITSYSFPSGHALSSFIFCSVLIYLVWDARFHPALKAVLIMLLLLCSVAIGISRIVLNVHYATDVIGGFCLGIMWVILCFYLFRKMRFSRFRPVKNN
jgi:undecaprenyl-diphosphatase